MAINGDHSIFRLNSGGITTETATSDKVEFDGTAAVPDARSHITSIRIVQQMIDNDNPIPGSQDAPGSQDVGNAPDLLEIKGYFDETGGQSLAVNSFMVWMRNAKKTKTLYPHGGFGFRSNKRDEYNVTPTSAGGYQLLRFEIEDVLEFSQPKFTILMKFVGDKTLLGI